MAVRSRRRSFGFHRGLLEKLHFLGNELAVGSHRQVFNLDRTNGNSSQLKNLVAHLSQHAPNLSIASLFEHDHKIARLGIPLLELDRFHTRNAFCQSDTAAKEVEIALSQMAVTTDKIGFFDPVPRVRQTIGQCPVVRNQDQSFRGAIQSADWKQPEVGMDQINHPRPTTGVAVRANHSKRFIEQEIGTLGLRQRNTVDSNFLAERVDSNAQSRYCSSIDFDTARKDELFAFAATGNAGRCQNFLEPLATRR